VSLLDLAGTSGAKTAAATLRIAAAMDLLASAMELLRLTTSESGASSAQIYVVDVPSALIFRGYGRTSEKLGSDFLPHPDEMDEQPWSVPNDGRSLVG